MKGLERYTKIREIGKGAQGTVILALDTVLGRQVAIKSLHNSLIENDLHKKRFKEEAKTLASISNHPSIITIYEFIVNDSGCHLIMEYFDGHPLDTFIQNITGPIQETQAIDIFSQVLEAMKYLHQKKIIHRDIKPSNIMVNKEGKVQLLDFGIAKNTENDPSLTIVGESAGYTPMYMSPEHCNGEKITNQSDIYSLGVTLWQMLTGIAPYENLTQGQIYIKVAKEPLPSVQSVYEHVSLKMNNVVQKATDKAPKNRYKNCNAFLKDIKDVKNHIKELPTFFLHKLSIKIEDDLDANISINNHSYFGSEFSEPFTSNEPIVIIIQKNGYKKIEKILHLINPEHLDIKLKKNRFNIAPIFLEINEKSAPYLKNIKPNLISIFTYLKLTSLLIFTNIQLKLNKNKPELVSESNSNLSKIKGNIITEAKQIKLHKKEFLAYSLFFFISLFTLISLISNSPVQDVPETPIIHPLVEEVKDEDPVSEDLDVLSETEEIVDEDLGSDEAAADAAADKRAADKRAAKRAADIAIKRLEFYTLTINNTNVDKYSKDFSNDTFPRDKYFITVKIESRRKFALKVYSYNDKLLLDNFTVKGQIKNLYYRDNILYTNKGFKIVDLVRCHKIDIIEGSSNSNLGDKLFNKALQFLGPNDSKIIRLINKD